MQSLTKYSLIKRYIKLEQEELVYKNPGDFGPSAFLKIIN